MSLISKNGRDNNLPRTAGSSTCKLSKQTKICHKGPRFTSYSLFSFESQLTFCVLWISVRAEAASAPFISLFGLNMIPHRFPAREAHPLRMLRACPLPSIPGQTAGWGCRHVIDAGAPTKLPSTNQDEGG